MESRGGDKPAQKVIRAKGLIWLATRRSHWQQGMASLAGNSFNVQFGGLWEAALVSGVAPASEEAKWGDRRTELVVIGQDMDHTAVKAALEACIVNDEEMEIYATTTNEEVRTCTSLWIEAERFYLCA